MSCHCGSSTHPETDHTRTVLAAAAEMAERWAGTLALLADRTCTDDACPPCSEIRRRRRDEP